MTRVVAIHQPNFFPWVGYFDKIARSDCFVFLDDVQMQKKGGTWSNRTKMFVSGTPKWATASIDRNYHGVQEIRDTLFDPKSDWRKVIFRTIQSSYRNSPYYKDTIELIEPLLMNPDENLATYNAACIVAIAEEIGISTNKFSWSSQLDHSGQSNELLVSIVKSVGGDVYMCGGGASGYQDQTVFDLASIELVYQNYVPFPYQQFGGDEFVPGLSIIDVLMSIGLEGARNMLASNPVNV